MRERWILFKFFLGTGLWSAAVTAFAIHPWILWSVLLATNVEGDIIGNYARLVVIAIDFIVLLVGAVYIDDRMRNP